MIENCKNHQEQICWVNKDSNIDKTERFLCQKCKSSSQRNQNLISIEDGNWYIKNYQDQEKLITEIEVKENINRLNKMLGKVQEIKNNIFTWLEAQAKLLNKWVEQLNKINNKDDELSLFDKLDVFFRQKQNEDQCRQQIQEKIGNINNIMSGKNDLEQLQTNFNKEIEQQLAEIIQTQTEKKSLQNQVQNKQLNPLQNQKNNQTSYRIKIEEVEQYTLKLINDKNKQQKECLAIVFNKNGSIMVSTEAHLIKTWDFKNNILQVNSTLKGHQVQVNQLLYSRMSENFLSSDLNGIILCWSLGLDGKWISSQKYQIHKEPIQIMILKNCSENQLFTGSSDKTIKIWNLNFNKNDLEFMSSLESHQVIVTGIHLNQADKILISCDNDSKIKIWQKSINGKWETKQTINLPIYSKRSNLLFTKDDQFILVPHNKQVDFLYVYEKKGQEFELNTQKTLQLQIYNLSNDANFFSTYQYYL
ncbi:unnamed protein product [Paramecium sonneborni]|uniref:WD40-repeat-containing domain n=1 Tax=Paramecium sonneborni TaxID=65129 RepID=A0A8S1KMN8_9CILI|nr:unnamed protein product [Paramecium sonneborni]